MILKEHIWEQWQNFFITTYHILFPKTIILEFTAVYCWVNGSITDEGGQIWYR